METTFNFFNLLAMFAVMLSAATALWALRGLSHCKRQQVQQAQAIADLEQDLRALCAGATGVDARLLKLETEDRRIRERQEQLELHEQGARLYSQAIRMVKKGADVDELMSTCSLSRNEAQLIAMMHGADHAAQTS